MDNSIAGPLQDRSMMPRLERMRQVSEYTRLQTEISMLEQQIAELETSTVRSPVRSSATQTDDEVPNMSRYVRIPPDIKSEPQGILLHGRTGYEGNSVVERRHGDQLFTSTPKAEGMAPYPGLLNVSENTDSQPALKKSSGTKIKPATFDGTGNWLDYKAHFEVCAQLNGWSEQEKGLCLAVSLRGQAQGVFGNIANRSHDYIELVKALEDRFAPPNQTELYRVQLRERRQKASESLSELGQDIRRLTNLAYPTAPSDLRETLAKEQFIDALVSSDMRLRIKQARPKNLNDAVRHAVELEAFNRAERQHLEGQGFIRLASDKEIGQNSKIEEDMKTLQKSVSDMQKAIEAWKRQKPHVGERTENTYTNSKNRPRRSCYICGSERHMKYRCPQNKDGKYNAPKQDNKHQAKYVATTSSGLYATCKINDVITDCLIDTGATLSILSSKAWNTISQSSTGYLKVFESQIFTASGNQIDAKGIGSVVIEICGMKCVTDIVVADIDMDAILGLDFLKTNDCQLDMLRDTLTIKGKSCSLKLAGKVGCYRVTVSEPVEIPSKSEIIIEGKTCVPVLRHNDLGIVEPIQSCPIISHEKERGIVAKTLVRVDDKVPVRIANLGDESKKLYPGTHIANLSMVSKVHDINKQKPQPYTFPQVPDHLQDLFQRTINGLSCAQSASIAKLLIKHQSTFSESDNDLGRTGIIRHRIPTGNAHPIKQPLRRLPVQMNQEAQEQINDMLEKDVIQPSSSPWASGIVMVQKKDGTKRFCVDYRRLNDVTIKDAYPLPRIDDSLAQLSGAEWFSCLDLNSGYWQVEVDASDREKTAFSSKQGLFEFKVMPFGLCNAPATFERLMEIVLSGLNWQICLIYLDDVIVIGRTFDDMISNLDQVLQRLKDAGLKLKPRKCQLFAQEVEFLGHVINREGVKTDPKKTQVIRDWPRPNDIHKVRSFLGFCSYYRRFVPKFAEIAKPLHRLSEKHQKFVWSDECNQAFETLKNKMVTAPILAHPDFKEHFILDTDASDVAIGAVLSQTVNGQERVIAFASRALTKAERRYCVTRKELLALVHFVKYFRHYLYGKSFTVRTDHGSLRWLMNFKNPEGQLARWLEILSSYTMKIEHRPGRQHKNADGLSRIPCRQCGKAEIGDNKEIAAVYQVTAQHTDEQTKEIRSAQESDPDVCKVKSWVEKGYRQEQKEIACESHFVKSLWCQWSRLQLEDGILVRRWDLLGTDIVHWQAIVPLSQRRVVLNYAHDIKASGHLGIRKTLGRIRQRFYWPGLQNDVRAYVNGCEKCTKRKDPNMTKKAPLQAVRSGYPMERIAVDILGELPLTEKGNKYILVLADYFTKWTECFPMANMETSTIAKIIMDEVISRFGTPGTIHSDQGRQFESNLFREFCKLLQIDKTRTTPYHPQSDGMVERFNKTLTSMLSTFVQENQKDWDEHIPYVMMAYRSSEHETTGVSPNLLMLGRETSTPLDIVYQMPPSIKPIPANQWVWELRERLESVHTMVRQNTGASMRRQKKYHDKKVSYEKFMPGDHVYVYFPVRTAGCSSKLTSFWRGPYQVSEKLSDVLYRVNCGRANTLQVIHCDRMRKAKEQILTNEELDNTGSLPNAETELDIDITSSDKLVLDDLNSEETDCHKRLRRKPQWMEDYILSNCRSTMPPVKTTPRKHAICPVCKDPVNKEDFQSHLMKCPKERVECSVCGQTFKKVAYRNKHMKVQHSQSSNITCRPSATPVMDNNVDSESETEDWDVDPDVEVGEDSTEVKDLTSGRIIRKPTHPLPVSAPKKAKFPEIKSSVSKTEAQQDKLYRSSPVRASKKMNCFATVTSYTDTTIHEVERSSPSNVACMSNITETETEVVDTTKSSAEQSSATLKVEFLKRKNVSSEITVYDETDDKIFSVFSIKKSTDMKEEPEINLGDILPKDAIIKANDIRLKRVLLPDGGQLTVNIKYDQK